MEKHIRPGRLLVLILILIAFVVAYGVNLYKLQIVEGSAYYEMSQNSVVSTQAVTAARGNILDRYGRTLVTNRSCNNLSINSAELFSLDDPNGTILQICQILDDCEEEHNDDLPITMTAPFSYVDDMTDEQKSMLEEYVANIRKEYDKSFPAEPTAVELMAFFRTRYDIDNNYDSTQMRRIAGVRYSVNVRHVATSYSSDYILAEDVSIDTITKLKERGIRGFNVDVAFTRSYETDSASHLLGYIGQMDSEEYETYKKDGYSMNALVGKDGAELAFEKYLHGTDGVAAVTSNANGTITGTTYTTEPQPGDNVYLTIDLGLQEAAEQALGNYIASANATRSEKEAIPGGALVAIDVKTGEPLALASYPTYSMNDFLDNYEKILDTPNAPLLNRALIGLYEPGSTYKPCTAIAALDTGVITPNTYITDEVTYTKYANAGYAPSCWIKSSGGSHGSINVSQALTVSCNYFFYYVGDQLGEEVMTKYAKLFGFGQPTGIELTEYDGHIATAEYIKQAADRDWYVGDNLQAAIGQSVHQFTPIQIANYIAAVANNGVRYSTSILKQVRSYDYSQLLYDRQPEVTGTVETAQYNWDAIHEGMRGVANNMDGTAASIFADFPYCTVAAKTGTAQTGDNKMNNAVFVAYAPYDDPQIAICVVVEKGSAGSSIGTIARDVLEYYFSFQDSSTGFESENSLLK